MTRSKRAAGLWIRLAKCHALVLREMRDFESRSELTLPQFDVLAQLLRFPEGMTAGALSRALLVTAGNVTGIAARLQSRGLVTRTILARDRRSAILRLTPAGRRLAAAQVLRHERHLGRIFAAVPAGEQARIGRALDRFRKPLERRRR